MTIRVNLLTALRNAACAAFLLIITGSAFAQSNAGNDRDLGDYLIHPGDLLEVSVWREEYLERDVVVQPDGRISFPLVGVLDAAGKTVSDLQVSVSEQLEQYFPDPVVTVSIKEIRGNTIYILGQVARPGQIVMNPVIDVMQALALVGGTTPFAEVNDIKILRRTGNTQTLIQFRYGDVERGRNLDQNIILKSGDVIIVP